jgi:hypothetical protein
MSETWVQLVPRNEQYIPSNEAISLADKYFCEEVNGWEYDENAEKSEIDEVKSEICDILTFFDAGTNDAGSIFCPNCGEQLDFEFLMEWQEEDDDDRLGYKFEPRLLQCCGKSFTLRELDYDFDQGFGHFCLEGMVDEPLDSKHISEFERILGCSLRVIYQCL